MNKNSKLIKCPDGEIRSIKLDEIRQSRDFQIQKIECNYNNKLQKILNARDRYIELLNKKIELLKSCFKKENEYDILQCKIIDVEIEIQRIWMLYEEQIDKLTCEEEKQKQEIRDKYNI